MFVFFSKKCGLGPNPPSPLVENFHTIYFFWRLSLLSFNLQQNLSKTKKLEKFCNYSFYRMKSFHISRRFSSFTNSIFFSMNFISVVDKQRVLSNKLKSLKVEKSKEDMLMWVMVCYSMSDGDGMCDGVCICHKIFYFKR